MKDQRRNLNPHRPAKCAMWLYGKRYASQGGGSMDFWDKLLEQEKNTCRRMAVDIVNTRPESESEFKKARKINV